MHKEPISLKKVSVHNLKKVDLELEPGKLIVFTGVSGSGKSSLAFDTIYVEGQRRYIESLSHQARRYLGDLPKPEAESITGIAPTIAIEQKLSVKTPRSTVGTLTGIYDFLRVLFAKIAIPHCPVSLEPVRALSREKILQMVEEIVKDEKLIFLASFVKGKKGEFKEDFAELLSKGYTKLRIDGKFVDLSEEIFLDGKTSHDIDIVIDRIKGSDRSRLKEAVEQSLEVGKGFFSLYFPDQEIEKDFSQFAYSKKSGLSYGPLEIHDFSFNHPLGMCLDCQGIGLSSEFDLEKIIDPELSISEDCCKIASSYQTVRFGNIYDNLAKIYKFNIKTPWKKLSKEAKDAFLYGTEKKWTRMHFTHPVKKQRWYEYVQWKGVIFEAKERLIAAKSDLYRKKMKELMKEGVCSSCLGARIKPYPREAKLNGKRIFEVTALSLEEALHFFQTLSLSELEQKIASEIVKEIVQRIEFLIDVGLSYLSLDRTSPTLSGGESQRVRLASQIGAGLVGAIYVLDEPSIGLHPTDHHKLIETLLALRDLGNTVIVVEHDMDTIFAADLLVDVGPGAGQHGGEILAVGSPDEIMKNPRSITGAYLSKSKEIETPKKRRKLSSEKLKIIEASHHNLKSLTAEIPLEGLICVTGVSGSGKSSLISDILYPALSNHLHKSRLDVGKHKKIEGLEFIDKVISVDQSPIGRTPRSNAATYIKLFDEIRDLFASLHESKVRGFDVGHFSFNVKKGTCPYCSGLGQVKMDMDFMEDIWIECPQCKGKRFDPEILAVQFKGKSISDVLNLDVERALELFDSIPSIQKKLKLLSLVGLDYLPIGQPSTTLSGGEAQRIKLAKELVRPSTGRTLYIFDEPTTGLHFHDVKKLIAILNELVEKKNTVLVIEHNLDLIKSADWILDLGPKAGIYGGELIGKGTPEEIAKKKTPTGISLKELFTNTPSSQKAPQQRKKQTPFQEIRVEKARQNNLKEISLSIPRNKISVFTGPSGSGKTSLAFETLYAEGQRRYTETLSSYARSLVKPLPKPYAEKIEGLLPSIALEQKTGGLNPRSTVGTITEVYDLLRVFYAHLGTAFDPDTHEEISQITKEKIVERVLLLPPQEKIQVLAPIEFEKKETFNELLERLNRQGYLRIRLNQETFEIDEKISYDPLKKNELLLVIDRLTVDEKNQKRLYEAIEKATNFSEGMAIISTSKEDLVFNLSFSSVKTGKSYPPITPQTFSFNHDKGMCPDCQGLGLTYGAHLTEEKKVLNKSCFDLLDRLMKEKVSSKAYKLLDAYFKAFEIDPDIPLKNLSDDKLHIIFNGGEEKKLKNGITLYWKGIHPLLEQLAKTGFQEVKEALLPLMSKEICPSCEGTRLNPLAKNVRIENVSLPDFCRMSILKASEFIEKISLKDESFLKETKSQISKSLQFLLKIGLNYLTLERSAPTLSGGELQRIRLAKQLGSGLTGCLYVLDEPTIGLHPYNNERLNLVLKDLVDLGNTLILVEHDPMTVSAADYLFDFGPKAGKEGGKITAQGTLKEIKNNPNSLTGAYLTGKRKIPVPKKRKPFSEDVKIEGANLHNLKNLTLAFPYAAITCLTGVSGSGKSTLMRHLLKPALEKFLHLPRREKNREVFNFLGTHFQGLNHFEKVVTVDQSPIGQTIRADVSTYTDVQPLIRALLASLPKAAIKGLQPRHFSPNHIRGMCRTCWGLGFKKVDLQFMPAVKIPCEACHGNKINPISLEITYQGKHFGEILKMNISEALQFFANIPRIVKRLNLIESVGLSYLTLGQEVVSLSGGEAQRLKLSRELAKREIGKTLYLIDEPTVGLHSVDVEKLLPIFHRLKEKKNTLLIIEHNLDLIANADYVIDLGPDAGDEGGHIMAQGTPEEVALSKTSKIAAYLKGYLEK